MMTKLKGLGPTSQRPFINCWQILYTERFQLLEEQLEEAGVLLESEFEDDKGRPWGQGLKELTQMEVATPDQIGSSQLVLN